MGQIKYNFDRERHSKIGARNKSANRWTNNKAKDTDLTEERRKDLIKILKGMGEKGKISIRNIRREANEELKKKVKK